MHFPIASLASPLSSSSSLLSITGTVLKPMVVAKRNNGSSLNLLNLLSLSLSSVN